MLGGVDIETKTHGDRLHQQRAALSHGVLRMHAENERQRREGAGRRRGGEFQLSRGGEVDWTMAKTRKR